MQHQALLENYLRQLRLSTFAQNYQTFAQDATRTNLSYERYLLALCQAEAEQREANRIERAILNAKFPIMKELGSFDFSLVQARSVATLCKERDMQKPASAQHFFVIIARVWHISTRR